MGNLHDLALLLAIGAIVASWMKLVRARELAVAAARHHCEMHGLQLLDETVGLRSLRLRRIDGSRHLERGYAFEVSVDGDDRQPGRIWMQGRRVTGLGLPTVHWHAGGSTDDATVSGTAHPGSPGSARDGSNVVPLHRRQRPGH